MSAARNALRKWYWRLAEQKWLLGWESFVPSPEDMRLNPSPMNIQVQVNIQASCVNNSIIHILFACIREMKFILAENMAILNDIVFYNKISFLLNIVN